MKKICIVTKNMLSGGSERVISHLARYAVSQGLDIKLILLENKPIHYALPAECEIIIVGEKSKNAVADKLLRYKSIRKSVLAIKPDVVLSMPEEIGIYVIGALLGTRIPVVVSERNDPWRMPYKKVTRILRKILYPFATGLIFQTEQASMFFSKVLRKKGIVLPNPLDTTHLPQLSAIQREKTVVGAGRLEKQKNFPLLIEAFAEFHKCHPDYSLIIYGEGRERDQLEQLASEQIPAEAWCMPGRVPDLPDRIGRCGIFALSSDYEGMPNVLIEAMAVGTPVVSVDCSPGGAAALINNGENGLLVPVKNVKALMDGLSYLADNPAEARRMAKQAEKIRDLLDVDRVAKDWMDYLEKCVRV